MKYWQSVFLLIITPILSSAQFKNEIQNAELTEMHSSSWQAKKKLLQRNYGFIIGMQRGKGNAVELGAEMHWRKMSLFNPNIKGAFTNLEYNFSDHIMGYKAGMWMKQGRINFTYGGHLVYFTDFDGLHRYGLGPNIGFRLAGFHFINGYNLLLGDKEMTGANTMHVSLRYYFSKHNQFTWDKKTRKKKASKREEKKGLRKLFQFSDD